VTFSRIALWKDVHYLTVDQIPGFPLISIVDIAPNPIVLGENEYYTLGDNSTRSKDSRFWGTVTSDALIGVARWIYWPPNRWHEFR
jgi:hypothetical protein